MRPIAKLATIAAGALVAAALATAPAQAGKGDRHGGPHGAAQGKYDSRHGDDRHYSHRHGHGPYRHYTRLRPAYRVAAGNWYRPPVYHHAPGALVIVIRP